MGKQESSRSKYTYASPVKRNLGPLPPALENVISKRT